MTSNSEFIAFVAAWFACIFLVVTNFAFHRLLRQSIKQNRELLTMVNDLVARLNQASAITAILLEEKRQAWNLPDQEEQSGKTLH